MNIAINTRFLIKDKLEGFGWYTYQISKRLVEQHPEHTFFFFFDRPYDSSFLFSKNVVPVVLFPPARHPFLFYLFFEFAVKKALRKHKIDLFFSPDGYLSLKSKVPQINVMHDLNFEHYPHDLPYSARVYLKYFFPRFAKKATKIITVSNFSKTDIIQTYQIDNEKIEVIYNAAAVDFKPISENEQQSVREKYTQGNPFFLFVGSLHPRKNLERLLEAFVLFNERLDSNMHLIIVGNAMWKDKNYMDFVPIHLRSKINFFGYQRFEDLTKITASAKLLTYLPYFEGFGIPLVEAMQCGVPVLTSNVTSLPEVVGDAGLLADPFNVEHIVLQMILFEQDIVLQKDLQHKALMRSKRFSWDTSAQKVWQVIEEALPKK